MSSPSISKMFLVIISATISILSGIFFTQIDNQTAFGFEENILALQSGIISTSNQDFAISQDFETRIFQDGRIMRLSGITTTGEQYYLYQKIVGDETNIKGKILINGNFIPIVQKFKLEEKKIEDKVSKEILVLVEQPHHGYYFDTYTLTAKAFESDLNPKGDFNQNDGYVEGVKINVTLTNRFDELLTSFAGMTNQFGTYTGKYIWGYTDLNGEYNVTVAVDDGKTISTQYLNTFYRGYVSNYTGN